MVSPARRAFKSGGALWYICPKALGYFERGWDFALEVIVSRILCVFRTDHIIYEWEQTLEEVLIFIYPPEGIRAKDLDILIQKQHLRVGIRGNPPFLDADLESTVSVDNSLWTLGASATWPRRSRLSVCVFALRVDLRVMEIFAPDRVKLFLIG